MILQVGTTYALRKAPNNPRKRVLIVEYDALCKDSSFRGQYVGTNAFDRWYSDGSYRGNGVQVPKDLVEVQT